MIQPKLFTMSLTYKVNKRDINENNFEQATKEIINSINKQLSDNNKLNEIGIINTSNSTYINDETYPNLELVIVMYAAIDSKVYHKPLLKTYLETNCSVINIDTSVVKLIKRKVYSWYLFKSEYIK